MSHVVKYLLLIFSIFIVSCTSQVGHKQVQNQRQEIDFNFAWKFSLSADDTAYLAEYDDSQWREVRLPHDWSIEADYAEQGRAGATGYLPGGTAWYRKTFTTPNSNNKTQIVFDGVYNHSKVWVNGYFLGERPYGYAPFYYDLTPYLHKNGDKNVIAVFVDHSRYVDSRWYTGSGIYRNVKLISTNKTHIPIWGSYVTTPKVSESEASLLIKTSIQNDELIERSLDVITELKDPQGNTVARVKESLIVAPTSGTEISQHLTIKKPALWSIDSPTLYSVVTRLIESGNILDSNTVTTGFRYFVNDPQQGFFLNGKSMKIKGVNIHHDGGLVGAAVPKGVWKRRLQTLKDAGVNAIRTAHNPASAEFLDLCDEMGFLVQAEAFDEWDNPKDKRKNFNQTSELDYITQSYSQYFAKWAERDLKAMLYRDRNHPSIF